MFVGMRVQPFSISEDQHWTEPFHISSEAKMVFDPALPAWVLPRAAFLLQEKLVEMGYSAQHPGKMFGVLVVRLPHGGYGFLAAFSGSWDKQFPAKDFVPPVFNWSHPEGFFRKTEAKVNHLTKEIVDWEHQGLIAELKHQKTLLQTEATLDLAKVKDALNRARAIRQQERANHPFPHEDIRAHWERESQMGKADYRRKKLAWEAKIAEVDFRMTEVSKRLEELQGRRKAMTTALQAKLFKSFILTNHLGLKKSVLELFQTQGKGLPPSGAGDCAAPKLLHHAFLYGFRPLALTEFWWGSSPNSILRRQGYFYPVCQGKCVPLMPHLLHGLKLYQNPGPIPITETPKVVCQTQDFLVVQKPSGWLSVPGKSSEPELMDWLKKQNIAGEGLYAVHRLDRDTSGLLLVALHRGAYTDLQKQFAQRTVEKEYLAWVHGVVHEVKGEISLPLTPDWSNRPRQMVCETTGKPSLTQWHKIGEKDGKTLLKVNPITGRTHQIRVHLAHPRGLNIPIVGDPLYGMSEGKLALHAYSLAFDDPSTGERRIIDWPLDFFTLNFNWSDTH